jgi:hypothetical protein
MAAPVLVSAASTFEQRLDALPAPLRAKYRALEDYAEVLGERALAAFSRWHEAHAHAATARAAFAALESSDKRGLDSIHARAKAQREGRTYEPPAGSALAAAATDLARCEERVAQRLATRDATEQARTDALRLLASLRAAITTADAATWQPLVVDAPGPDRSPTNLAGDLARVREALAAVASEATALARAPLPLPLSEAHARLDAWLDGMARQYDPPPRQLLHPAGARLPSPEDLMPYRLVPLLACLPPWRDVLHDRLATAYATLPASVRAADRPAAAAAVAERRQQLEIAEERLVLLAARAGLDVARRPDADAATVLRVVLAEGAEGA